MAAPTSQTPAQVREHYEIEKALAARLRGADAAQRRTLYTAVYDELLRCVSHHPLLTGKHSPESVRAGLEYNVHALEPFLRPDTVFLEVGAGDCALSLELCKRVKHVYAIDVSAEITANLDKPDNFELILSDGSSIPVPPESVDVAFSNQLMEHLHPQDAEVQLRGIYTALRKGGTYICFTPSRLNGPHDVSASFDPIATGLHLHEYTTRELVPMMKQVGFTRAQVYFPSRQSLHSAVPVEIVETMLSAVPHGLRRSLASKAALKKILGVKLVVTK
jgi:ubiquinone/menaquinone biosynthesis C-methylase UbiE